MEITNMNLENYKIKVNNNNIYLFLKRTLDIVGSLTGIILLAPIFIIVAICINLDQWYTKLKIY